MEYLMTYGWALLVIVVAGAALFALGVLNPSTYAQKRCQGFQYFTYQDHQLTTDQFQINLINGPQTISSINSVTVGTSTDANVTSSSPTVAGGTQFTATANVSGLVAQNQTYSYVVRIVYDVSGGIQDRVDQGTCTGIVA
jgi:hypothetical protein